MFNIASLLTTFDDLQIKVFTWRHGELVGTDPFGNRYYRSKRPERGRSERRWVLYKGTREPSKIPPEWYGWMHYTLDAPLGAASAFHQPWVKAYEPNLTGTPETYLPPGHPLRGGQRAPATGDYQPWIPN